MEKNIEVIVIDKIDAAQSHFEEAVLLFFEKRDPIAIHHLINAAHEILNKLTKKSFLLNNKYLTDEGQTVLKRKFLESKNFIKHLGDGQNNSLEFNPELNKFLLLDCSFMMHNLIGNSSFFAGVYVAWCIAANPELFSENIINEIKLKLGFTYLANDYHLIVNDLRGFKNYNI